MKVIVYFEPRDIWIGAYFKKWWLDVYICPLPTLVLRVTRA